MTQEEVAEKVGVSAQAVSKWEAGDCLPDCFNLKAISDIYQISADVLLETESSGDIEAVSAKIEQLGTEFLWSAFGGRSYTNDRFHCELGEDLLSMWKGIYFAETGDRRKQQESKELGNLRIRGPFGMKIWDDDGVVCVIKNALIEKMQTAPAMITEVMEALCSEDGQRLILALGDQKTHPKEQLLSATGLELHRLNELLLLFSENRIIAFVSDHRECAMPGYQISGHCGIAAYMVLGAIHILMKRNYSLSEYLDHPDSV
ncbi:MAG: helix-turn-helix transcriptional regulator [Clostridia bacterium]|nr:helix-turn-helix transcriptional regulator [Clostridia bacterium]